MTSQAIQIRNLIGYEGEGEWYKPVVGNLGQRDAVMVEILQVGLDRGEIQLIGRVVDDNYEPTSLPGSATGIVPVSGLNPQTLVYTRS